MTPRGIIGCGVVALLGGSVLTLCVALLLSAMGMHYPGLYRAVAFVGGVLMAGAGVMYFLSFPAVASLRHVSSPSFLVSGDICGTDRKEVSLEKPSLPSAIESRRADLNR